MRENASKDGIRIFQLRSVHYDVNYFVGSKIYFYSFPWVCTFKHTTFGDIWPWTLKERDDKTKNYCDNKNQTI